MPWWFWPMAALWTVPPLIVVWMVVAIGRELLADRRLARGEADREARAESLIARGEGRMVYGDASPTDWPPNPRARP